MQRTRSGLTWQKLETFFFTSSPIGSSLRQTMRSGLRPEPRSSLTLAWVGLVFGSPVDLGCWFPLSVSIYPQHLSQLTWGTRETWTQQKLSVLTRNWNWRKASTKGMPSMSPMVPPSSMMQTSGSFPSSVTGILATFSTHSWIASVIWGTTVETK